MIGAGGEDKYTAGELMGYVAVYGESWLVILEGRERVGNRDSERGG